MQVHPSKIAMCLVITWPPARWEGNKAKELGRSCKLLRKDANEQGRNGLGIALFKEMKDNLII